MNWSQNLDGCANFVPVLFQKNEHFNPLKPSGSAAYTGASPLDT